MLPREATRRVWVGGVPLGGGAPVAVQGMTKTDTRDLPATLSQVRAMAARGCELVRVAVPDAEAARSLPALVRESPVPVIADIHFDYRLALAALEAGVAKLRLNPGNLKGREAAATVAREARARGVPVRVGVNLGSLPVHGAASGAAAMVTTALEQARVLEDAGLTDIVLGLKASDVLTTLAAYRLASQRSNYPLHLGLTEAGTAWSGGLRSAVGLGILLAEGIGDTIRVSLAASALQEVDAAYVILGALGLRERGVRVVACPTCGRCRQDLGGVADAVEDALRDVPVPLTVAVMGCEVNGPGEAKAADLGVAATPDGAVLFREGNFVRRLRPGEIVPELVREVRDLALTRQGGSGNMRDKRTE